MELSGRALRLVFHSLLALIVIGLIFEVFLRGLGLQPQDLYRAGFSATVIDRWTEWAMRPRVRLNEYTVTNDYGLHEDREITLRKPPGVRRVAVVGSSVTWGLGERLADTIPRAAEQALVSSGCRAEVLNFGSHGYNIVNASAYIQTKVHQFEPDAIVVMMDLQMAFPGWPFAHPVADEQALVRRLGVWEAMFKRVSEYSVMLTVIDNVGYSRALLTSRLPFPLEPKKLANSKLATTPTVNAGPNLLDRKFKQAIDRLLAELGRLKARDAGDGVNVRPAAAVPPVDTSVQTRDAYEAKRERELGAVVAGLAAFSAHMNIPLYFVTPYGPYFRFEPGELPKFSLNMLGESSKVYGSLEQALPRETELITTILTQGARNGGAQVIDMLSATRQATSASGDFSTDGIHFSAKGYRRVGGILAERLRADGLCADSGLASNRN